MNKTVLRHITENRIKYTVILSVFIFGIAFGAYYTSLYKPESIEEMREFFDAAINAYKTGGPDFNAIFKTAFREGIRKMGYIWLLGFTVIGIAMVFLSVFKCGFMCGFLTGFLIGLYGLEGIGISVLMVLSKCVFYIPLMFYMSSEAVRLSYTILRMISGKIKYRTDFRYYIMRYLAIFIICAVIMVLYALSEAYIGGNMLKVYLKS